MKAYIPATAILCYCIACVAEPSSPASVPSSANVLTLRNGANSGLGACDFGYTELYLANSSGSRNDDASFIVPAGQTFFMTGISWRASPQAGSINVDGGAILELVQGPNPERGQRVTLESSEVSADEAAGTYAFPGKGIAYGTGSHLCANTMAYYQDWTFRRLENLSVEIQGHLASDAVK